MPGASIYILRCADQLLHRPHPPLRVSEHAQKLVKGCYTESRLPVELVFSEHYERTDEAVAAERRIKGWSRAKKEAMMRGDFAALSALARRKVRGGTGKSAPSSFETATTGPPQDEGA